MAKVKWFDTSEELDTLLSQSIAASDENGE